jgi:glutathione-independent formaldehyde dehydrogenase
MRLFCLKAIVFNSPFDVTVKDIADPKIQEPTDVVIKITSSGICGSDLHMYDGHTAAKPGLVFGHEPMGIVEKVGDDVKLVKKGDRVVVPFNVACGVCYNCVRGFTSACLTMNPKQAGAAYGYVDMGPYDGGQAEYLRVPRADWACLKLPGEPGDDMEDDFVLLSDVFPTAYYATEMAGVQSGSTVGIFGAGPVGLLAAYSSILKGASEVYVVDRHEKRLDLAKKIGAIPINFTEGDPVEQIINLRKSNKNIQQSLRPGEEKLAGVMCGIDAVGYEAIDREHPDKFNSNQVITDLIRLVNPTGKLGIIGVYLTEDPTGETNEGQITIPFGLLWNKGLTVNTGQAPVKNYHMYLRDLIISGKAKPSFIVSNHFSLDQAPNAYKQFCDRSGVSKAIIKVAA